MCRAPYTPLRAEDTRSKRATHTDSALLLQASLLFSARPPARRLRRATTLKERLCASTLPRGRVLQVVRDPRRKLPCYVP